MNIQALFDKYPVLNQLLDFLDHYGGLILAAAFFWLMIRIFYWIIVIAPRRVKRIFAELSKMGYVAIDPVCQEVSEIVTQLAPIYPTGPRKDKAVPEWKKRLAVKLDAWNNAQRYVVNVSRSQVDSLGRMSSTLRKTNLLLEKRNLQFSEPVHIYPKKNICHILWEDQYNLKKISSGVDKAFLEKYNAYSASGEIGNFSEDLRDALMNSCDVLCDTSRYCFQGGVTLKFQKQGWGICPANEIYGFKDMKVLIKIADAISNALS